MPSAFVLCDVVLRFAFNRSLQRAKTPAGGDDPPRRDFYVVVTAPTRAKLSRCRDNITTTKFHGFAYLNSATWKGGASAPPQWRSLKRGFSP